MESDERVRNERKKLRKRKISLFERFIGKVRREIWELLTTTGNLMDKTQEEAPRYFSTWNVAFIGLFKRVLFSGLFFYFFYTVYLQTTKQQQFVGAAIDSGVCQPVPITWDGTYFADYQGYWSGRQGYKNNLAVYAFMWSHLQLSPSQYTAVMTRLNHSLHLLGERGKQSDLAQNLLFWSSWKATVTTVTGGVSVYQVLTLSGNPRMIMWNSFVQGSISNVLSDCILTASSETYAKSDAKLNMYLNVPTFYAERSCSNTLNPHVLGWNPEVDNSTISFSLDVNTLFTAVAVSTGVNGLNSFTELEVVSVVVEYQEYRGAKYSVLQMYDPLYPQMTPVYCVGPSVNNRTGFNDTKCISHFEYCNALNI